uniref:Uncharacterized protein n=1 Tax=Opuntia streptacantha TaxID=393608 RepID=A0A7C9DGE2_OPUST
MQTRIENFQNFRKKNSKKLPPESRGHLIGESTSDDHTIRLTRARPKNNPKSIQVIPGCPSMHHLNSTTSQPEGHGPNGPTSGPVHQGIHLRDHVLRRLRKLSRNRRRRRPSHAAVCSRRLGLQLICCHRRVDQRRHRHRRSLGGEDGEAGG